jgi:hypothetical protein
MAPATANTTACMARNPAPISLMIGMSCTAARSMMMNPEASPANRGVREGSSAARSENT